MVLAAMLKRLFYPLAVPDLCGRPAGSPEATLAWSSTMDRAGGPVPTMAPASAAPPAGAGLAVTPQAEPTPLPWAATIAPLSPAAWAATVALPTETARRRRRCASGQRRAGRCRRRALSPNRHQLVLPSRSVPGGWSHGRKSIQAERSIVPQCPWSRGYFGDFT